MKKNSQLTLRIPDQDREALHAHAIKAGVTTSDLVRAMIAREVVTGELSDALVPQPSGKNGWKVCFTDLVKRNWTVMWQTDGIRPFLFAWLGSTHDEDGRLKAPLRTQDIGAPRSDGPLLEGVSFPKEYLPKSVQALCDTGREDFDWDDPDYRAICANFKFDPDRGRPVFAARDKEASRLLLSIINGNKVDAESLAARTMWTMLRQDTPTSLSLWESVMEPGGHHFRARISHPVLRRVGRHLKSPRQDDMQSHNGAPNWALLHLLPCRHGPGCLSTVYLDTTYRPKGVAVMPAKMHKLRSRKLVEVCSNPELQWIQEDDLDLYEKIHGSIWRDRYLARGLKMIRAILLTWVTPSFWNRDLVHP